MTDQSRQHRWSSFALPVVIIGIVAALMFGWKPRAIRWEEVSMWGHAVRALRSILLASCVPVVSLLLGYSVIRYLHRRSREEIESMPLALSLALGWGVLSHVLWLLGAGGSVFEVNLFQSWMGFLLLVIPVLLAREGLPKIVMPRMPVGGISRENAKAGAWLQQSMRWIFLIILATLLLRLLLTALTPSFLYDVLEYHLPDAEWILATGTLKQIPGNTYSLMPQGIEILYAFGRLLEGHTAEHAPKLIHLFLGLSAAAVLNGILKEFAVIGWLRILGVLLFLSHPICFKLSADAYVDFGAALFGAAAVLSWLRAVRSGNSIYLLLSAVFLGFALSVKYPVMGVLILPFLLVLAPLTPRRAMPFLRHGQDAHATNGVSGVLQRTGVLQGFGIVVLLGVVCLAVYSPWLVRAIAIDASPFPPLTLPGMFAPERSPELAIRQFMAEAHQTVSPLSSPYWQAVFQRYHIIGSIWLVGVLFFLLHPRSGRRLRGMALLVIGGYLFWNLRPDSADRFLAPLLPVIIALGILLVHEIGRLLPRYGHLVVIPFLLWGGQQIYAQSWQAVDSRWISAGSGQVSQYAFLRAQLGLHADLFRAINRATQSHPNPKILLVYEARSAAIDVPSVSNTVFDPSPFWMMLRSNEGANPEAVLEMLRRQGVTHVAINEVELARLLRTYPATEARKDPAYQQANALPAPGGFHPAFLSLMKYYPPYFYFSDGRMEKLEQRLDAVLERIRQNAVWEEDLGGAKMWVAPIEPNERTDSPYGLN